jgi:hemoglobin
MAEPSLFDTLGGEMALTLIIDRFMERVFADSMIGFFFARADRARIKQKEYELAASSLGGPVSYSGRSLAAAHSPHPIAPAHFFRRLEILRQTLTEFEVPEAVARYWLGHNEKLFSSIVAAGETACTSEANGEVNSAVNSAVNKGQRGSP